MRRQGQLQLAPRQRPHLRADEEAAEHEGGEQRIPPPRAHVGVAEERRAEAGPRGAGGAPPTRPADHHTLAKSRYLTD